MRRIGVFGLCLAIAMMFTACHTVIIKNPSSSDTSADDGHIATPVHTAVSITERYIYRALSPQQKEWYLAIDEAVHNFKCFVDLTVTPFLYEWHTVYYCYMFDNPELFYLSIPISTVLLESGKYRIYLAYTDGVDLYRDESGQPTMDASFRDRILAKKTTFDAEVARIISTIPVDAPDVEKERLIYDYILRSSYYNTDAINNRIIHDNATIDDNWTAYGIMINKYGVCESYAEAFQTLCLAVGINCTSIDGTANGGGHKWNAVQLDGEWYACDITFDDPVGGEQGAARHRYFNLTSAEMEAKNHIVDDSIYYFFPFCNGTKYSVKNYYGNDFY